MKPYIDMNIKFRKEAKNDFEKYFFRLMNNATLKRAIKLVTTNERGNYLVSEPKHHTTNWFSEDLLAIEVKKIKVKMIVNLIINIRDS